jgi:orotidine-5'-phosphate decarboxylase
VTRQELISAIFSKKTYLCVGLDTDVTKIPAHLRSHPDAVFEFNKEIIDATKDLCIGYKINTAFYEALGLPGWDAMKRTLEYIPAGYFTIADAKRGDIGNTSAQYAKAFFETLPFDAITVAPYMGEDSVRSFLDHENKWTILLGLTSNSGAADFELQKIARQVDDLEEGIHTHRLEMRYLYETVLETASEWAGPDQLMFVVGATQAKELENIRKIIPDNFLLVPGVGAQGGSLADISKYGLTKDCGLLVNVSRAVIYAGGDEDFAAKARDAALQYQQEMKKYLSQLK